MTEASPPLPDARPVALVNRVGEVVTLSPDEARRALVSGYRPATPEEWKASEDARVQTETEANFQQRYGGLGGALAAANAGAARALTGGLSDVALRKLAHGGEEGQHIYEGLKAVAGSLPGVGPAILGAEALAQSADPENVQKGGFARALFATDRGFTKANPTAATAGEVAGYVAPALVGAPGIGGLAEGLAARGLGEAATGALGKALQSGVRMAARGAAEGAAMGAQQALSEDTLADHDVVSEHLASGALHGLLAGGAVGGVLGAGGSLLASGGSSIAKASLSRLAGKEGATLEEALSKMKHDQIVRMIGADSKSAGRQLERFSGGAERLGAEVADQLEKAGVRNLSAESPASILKALESRQASIGEELGSLRGKLDELSAETGVRPDKVSVRDRIFKEVIDPLDSTPGMKRQAVELAKYGDDFLEKIGAGDQVSFKKWNEFRSALDKKINWNARAGNEVTEGYKQIRRILEEEYEQSAEKASVSAGGSFAKEHSALKKQYQALEIAKDAVESKLGAKGGFGLGDFAAAAAVGGGPAGIAAGIGRRILREKGNAVLADVFGKMEKMAALSRVARQTEERLVSGVKGFLAEGGAGASARAPAQRALKIGGTASSASFGRMAARIGELAANPSAVAEHMHMSIGDLAQHAPKASMSTTASASRALQYLHASLPKPQSSAPTLQPHLDAPVYPETEIASFMRKLGAVLNPSSVLEHMKRGSLTREEVDALRATSPSTLQKIEQKLLEGISGMKKKLPYDKIVQLSLLLGKPLDGTMEPSFVRAVQNVFTQNAQSSVSAPRATKSQRPSKTPSTIQTPLERLEERP